jgi:type III secretion protein T
MGIDLAKLYAIDPATLMAVLGVCSVRALVAFSLLPMFASRTVPTIARVAMAVAVVLPVAMGHLDAARPLPVDLNSLSMISFLGKEATVGFVIGLGFGAFSAGLQTAGEIIDHQTGLTFTQNIDPVHGNNVSLTALFLERVLFVSLMAAGAMLAIIDTLYLSYEVWPIGQWAPAFARITLLNLVSEASKLFALSLLLAGPVLLVLFAVDIGMGLLNRAAPQLSIFNITLSMKSMVGLAVLVLALPMMIERVIIGMHEVTIALHVFLNALG